MSGAVNIFFAEAGKVLLAALDKHARESDPAKLLEGGDEEVAARWACSAVQLKGGKGWLVVPRADPVQFTESERRVRALSDGKYSGRSRYYDLAWLLEHAEAVALGLLVMGDGYGSNSSFAGGPAGDSQLVAVEDSADGKYRVEVREGGDAAAMELGAALVKVGAVLTGRRRRLMTESSKMCSCGTRARRSPRWARSWAISRSSAASRPTPSRCR